jgi:large subunit ribosomal protein L24
MAAKIKRDDTVQVLQGRDRGRRGEVRGVSPGKRRVIVTGVNIVKRHRRGTSPQDPGGIIEFEAPIDTSNLALVCSNCDQATRVGFRILEDGRKVRFCKRCDEAID